jgi:hypothetical protein
VRWPGWTKPRPCWSAPETCRDRENRPRRLHLWPAPVPVRPGLGRRPRKPAPGRRLGRGRAGPGGEPSSHVEAVHCAFRRAGPCQESWGRGWRQSARDSPPGDLDAGPQRFRLDALSDDSHAPDG